MSMGKAIFVLLISVLCSVIKASTEYHWTSAGITDITTISPPGDATLLGYTFNLISLIPSGYFTGLLSIVQIHLENNQIVQISDYAFQGVPGLQRLRLDNNSLTGISKYTFAGVLSLEYLYLDGNMIATIEIGSFHDQSDLFILSMPNNMVQTFPAGMFHATNHPTPPEFIMFNMHGNPIQCNSGMCWLKESPTWLITMAAPCAGPPPYTGTMWNVLTEEQLGCVNTTTVANPAPAETTATDIADATTDGMTTSVINDPTTDGTTDIGTNPTTSDLTTDSATLTSNPTTTASASLTTGPNIDPTSSVLVTDVADDSIQDSVCKFVMLKILS